MILTLISILSSLFIDRIFGECRRFHPIAGFGNISSFFEKKFNKSNYSNATLKVNGFFCWCFLVLPVPLLLFFIEGIFTYSLLIEIFFLYLCIGLNSLISHATKVSDALENNDIDSARFHCQMMVSRDTSQLNVAEISRAVVESILENGHDAVIASLFWFIIGGAPLAVLHRLANTLDAMWGYKHVQFLHFGWFSAKADDILGWPSALITSLLYAFQGRFLTFFKRALAQSKHYKSLNGGRCISAGASVQNILLGGKSHYIEGQSKSVSLGLGKAPSLQNIHKSILIVNRSVVFLVFALSLANILMFFNQSI